MFVLDRDHSRRRLASICPTPIVAAVAQDNRLLARRQGAAARGPVEEKDRLRGRGRRECPLTRASMCDGGASGDDKKDEGLKFAWRHGFD